MYFEFDGSSRNAKWLGSEHGSDVSRQESEIRNQLRLENPQKLLKEKFMHIMLPFF